MFIYFIYYINILYMVYIYIYMSKDEDEEISMLKGMKNCNRDVK